MQVPKLLRSSTGFTLTELMVVVAISAIMVGIGYSGFSGVQRRERVTAAANLLAGHLKEARMLATEKHLSHRILFSGNQYTLCPWDSASDFNTPSNPIVLQVNLSQDFPGVSINPTPTNFRFDMKGLPRNSGAGLVASNIIVEELGQRRCTINVSILGRTDVACADL
jgi:prepilin-type N-terminal cleavage/methylation domain-containing protein